MADKFSIVVEGQYREPLERLAAQLGFTWGDRGNVKEMVQAIALGQLAVENSTAFSGEQQQSLGRAVIAAIHWGNWPDALRLGEAYSAIAAEDDSLSGYVAAALEPLQRPWVTQLLGFIAQQQPFTLAYRDASDRPFTFSVCGAVLASHERRTYLDCWCDETQGNLDIPQLHHNWCLRLDRIVDASVSPLEAKWRSLDAIEAEFHLQQGLAHAYEPRPADTLDEWMDADTRRVKRSISSSFWFLREILRYGNDCYLVAPSPIKERLRKTLREMIQRY